MENYPRGKELYSDIYNKYHCFMVSLMVSDYMIVKCFKDCGQKKFGHYHCVFCKEQIIKRTAYGRHLSRHMKKKVQELFEPVFNSCGLLTYVLILSGSLYCKQYEPRSACLSIGAVLSEYIVFASTNVSHRTSLWG